MCTRKNNFMELVAPSHLCIILIGEAVINIKLTLGDKGDMIMKQKDYVYYGAYAPILEITESTVLNRLKELLTNISEDGMHSQAEHILSRVKSADSIQKKLVRKGHETDVLTALHVTSDSVGIRIVTHFIGDVYTILDYIKDEPSWKIVKIKDYISNPKPNGYRSLHIILEVPLHGMELDSLKVEIQLRTITMDCWACLEHQMKYKQDMTDAALLTEELRRCADAMAATDLSMQAIREKMQAAEEETEQ